MSLKGAKVRRTEEGSFQIVDLIQIGSRRRGGLTALNRALSASYLDFTVPTDARPFFFNQLRIFDVPSLVTVVRRFSNGQMRSGVIFGNLIASGVLAMILFLSVIAVIATILVPLKSASANARSGWLSSAACIVLLLAWVLWWRKLHYCSVSAFTLVTRSIPWAFACSA
jgi:hypothetical protein